jgi:glycine/D-amino acid oxidase-like deaminating enzyme
MSVAGSNSRTVIIVGAGVLGATLAHRLVLDGWKVTVIDQHAPGSMLGSSGGVSRLIRFVHGDNRADALAAWESLSRWRQIEVDTGAKLVTRTGLVWLARDDDEWEQAGHRILRDIGVPVERVPMQRARSLFPDLFTEDLRYLLYEPEAALITAQEALRALIDDAVRRGATFTLRRAQRDGSAVSVAGRRLTADHVVWAVGCWTAQVFPELLRASVIQQDTYYFDAPEEWSTPHVPAWSEFPAGITGSGSLAGTGMKVGLHEAGPAVALDGSRVADPDLEASARAFVRRRFPSLGSSPIVRSEVQHTARVSWVDGIEHIFTTGGVRLTRDAEHPSVWILGDGSGSVFKTAPTVAAAAASALQRS